MSEVRRCKASNWRRPTVRASPHACSLTRVLINCYENAPRELQRIAPVTGLFQRFAAGAIA